MTTWRPQAHSIMCIARRPTARSDWPQAKASTRRKFLGFTRFTTAGGWKWSTNILTMCATPRGVNDVYIEGFNTGTTLGAATTMGDLILLAGPGPFNGTGGLFGLIEQ